MNKWTRALLPVTVVVATVIGIASASSATRTSPAPAFGSGAGALNIGSASTPLESVFVPIKPCRIVDTRLAGGRLGDNQTRAFRVGGTGGFTTQGGHTNGCGIPLGVTAISFTTDVTSASATGYLRAYANGDSEPTASILVYPPGAITGAGGTVGISRNNSTPLRVRNHLASAFVVIDVFGYYREPIAGSVSSNGTLLSHSSSVLSSARRATSPTGVYVVDFSQDVTGCVLQVTPASTLYVVVDGSLLGQRATIAGRAPNTGDLVDTPVAFNVTC